MSTDILVRQNEKDRMIQEGHTISPIVNISETDAEFILEVEMVGLSKDDIEIQLTGKELKIKGKRPSCDMPKKYQPLLTEREPYAYSRTFLVDAEVQKDKIEAKYENGLLTLRLPKGEKALPRKIKIT